MAARDRHSRGTARTPSMWWALLLAAPAVAVAADAYPPPPGPFQPLGPAESSTVERLAAPTFRDPAKHPLAPVEETRERADTAPAAATSRRPPQPAPATPPTEPAPRTTQPVVPGYPPVQRALPAVPSYRAPYAFDPAYRRARPMPDRRFAWPERPTMPRGYLPTPPPAGFARQAPATARQAPAASAPQALTPPSPPVSVAPARPPHPQASADGTATPPPPATERGYGERFASGSSLGGSRFRPPELKGTP